MRTGHFPLNFIAAIVLLSAGCNYRRTKDDGSDQDFRRVDGLSRIGYAEISRTVLHPSCLRCHGEWDEDYAATFADKEKIWDRVFVRRDMPKSPTPPLNDQQLEALREWISGGAPEVGTNPEPNPSPTQGPVSIPSFRKVQEQVLSPRCMNCHKTFSMYDQVVPKLAEIRDLAVDKRTMPPRGGPLTAEQLATLTAWLDGGAPEYSDDNPAPAAPLEPKFSSIFRHVIEKRCIGCHTATGPAKFAPLTEWKHLLEGSPAFVTPFDPAASALIQAITADPSQTGSSPMPPVTAGPRVPPEQIGLIRQWIEGGALDN